MRSCTWRFAHTVPHPSLDAAEIVIVEGEDDRNVLARLLSRNPLHRDEPPVPVDTPGDLIVYSGSLSTDPSQSHPANWLAPGRAALDELCTGRLQRRREGRTCLLPHARHILNDIPSCLRFLDDHETDGFGLALNPSLLVEASMRADLDDHLTRIFEGLGPRLAYLLLDDLPSPDRWSDPPAVPARDLPPELMRRLIDDHLRRDARVVVPVEQLVRRADTRDPARRG